MMTMNTQINVLKTVAKIFNDEYIPALFKEKNEAEGIPIDMVSLLYPEYGNGDGEASVDMFFLPIAAANEEIIYFATVINIAENVPSDYREDLVSAVNILNFLTPFGSYVLSPNGSALFFKLVTPLPASLSEEALLEQVNLLVANALDIAEQYVGVLQKFARGQATLVDIEGLV